MAHVMILRGTALMAPTGFDGWYLKSFDFEAHDGQGEIDLTPDLAEAKRFETAAEALTFYQRSPVCRPLRPDGKPNRPLTASTWEFAAI